MSPKSKGRPKGRGRTKPKGRRRPSQDHDSVVDRVLLVAAQLGPNVDRLQVEASASTWIGEEIQENRKAQKAAQSLVTELGARLGGHRGSAAYLALHALRLDATERERATIDELLATAPGDHPHLPWAVDERPEPRRAWLASDAWGNHQVHVVGYDEPQPHQIAVVTSSSGGLMVWGISVEEPDGPGPWAEVLGRPGTQIEPADALRHIWDAILRMDLYYPPMWQPDAVELRALARGRAELYKPQPEDWHGIDDEERALLIEEFQARSALDAPDDVLAMLADTFVDFGEGYLHGGVLAWKPGEPERFLTDWVHRRVLLPDDAMDALPEALQAWIAFCLGRKGLETDDIAVVVDEVDQAREEYARLRADESEQSPHQQLMRYIAENEVDLHDRDAVDEAVSIVNATRLADLTAEIGREE